MSRSLTLLIGLLIALASPVLAVNPLDDDAGSGGDAGDLQLNALPLEPGSYAGSLTPLIDAADVYRFDGQAGEQVRMAVPSPGVFLQLEARGTTFTSQGPSYGFVFGGFGSGEATYLLPFDGPWYLRFSLRGDVGVVYSFTFEVSDPAGVVLSSSDAEWQTIEVRYSGATEIQAFARAAFPIKTGPASVMKTAEIVQDDGGIGASASFIGGAGLGTSVRVNDLAQASLVPLVQTNVTDGYGWSSSTWFLVGSGTVRLSVFTTAGAGSLAYVRLGTATVTDQARAEGDGLVQWTDSNADADPVIVVPGASIVGPRSLDLDVNDRFIGFFNAHGADAGVTDPGGNEVPLSPFCGCTFFLNPAEGVWRFSLGATTHVVAPEHSYLDGAFVPRLGIAADAWTLP